MPGKFYIPPDDKVIVDLPSTDSDPVTNRVIGHLKKHGFTTISDLSRALGLDWNVVSRRIKALNLKRRVVRFDVGHWHNLGYRYGEFTELDTQTIIWITHHVVGNESFAKTVNRILRGDTKPNPNCGCSFCLRDRRQPGDDGRGV